MWLRKFMGGLKIQERLVKIVGTFVITMMQWIKKKYLRNRTELFEIIWNFTQIKNKFATKTTLKDLTFLIETQIPTLIFLVKPSPSEELNSHHSQHTNEIYYRLWSVVRNQEWKSLQMNTSNASARNCRSRRRRWLWQQHKKAADLESIANQSFLNLRCQ